jgi:hypothetical protein
MPAFRGRVTEGEVEDLVAYVRAFGPEGAVAREPASGSGEFEKQYRQLEAQWDELQKQLRGLQQPTRR